jgi:hypothetical protein
LGEAVHSFTWHRTVILELIERPDLRNVNLVVQDDAPFPTPEHRAARRAFPERVPEFPQ